MQKIATFFTFTEIIQYFSTFFKKKYIFKKNPTFLTNFLHFQKLSSISLHFQKISYISTNFPRFFYIFKRNPTPSEISSAFSRNVPTFSQIILHFSTFSKKSLHPQKFSYISKNFRNFDIFQHFQKISYILRNFPTFLRNSEIMLHFSISPKNFQKLTFFNISRNFLHPHKFSYISKNLQKFSYFSKSFIYAIC